MPTTPHRRGRKAATTLGIAALGVAMTLAALTGTAAAHVGISSASTTDGVTTINFAFDHGCGTSPTIAVEMLLPPAATVVATDLMDGWVFDGTSGDGAGNSAQTARISGPAIADGQLATFTLVTRGHDTSVDHLVPAIQLCEQGEEAWIDPDQASPQAAPLLTATTDEPPMPTAATTDDPAPVAVTPKPVTAGDDVQADIDAIAEADAEVSDAPWAVILIAAVGAAAAFAIVRAVRSRRTTSP